MKRINTHNLAIKPYIFFIAFFIGVLILQLSFKPSIIELDNLKNLILSQATLDGVSIPNRVNLFYNLIFSGVAIILGCSLLLTYTFQFLKFNPKQEKTLLLLSIVGISIIFIQLIGVKTQLLIFFLLYLLSYKTICYTLGNSKYKKLRIFQSDVLSNSILTYSFLIFFTLLLLIPNQKFLIVYPIIVLLLSVIYYLLFNNFNLSNRKINSLFFPLVFTPILAFLSIELVILQFQKGYDLIGYKVLFSVLFSAVYIFYYLKNIVRKRKHKNLSTLFKKSIAPSIILSFGLLIYYFPIVNQSLEMYELANPANSIMRIFQFNEIPFVDFLSSHMFSEQWYGIIYSLFFGYNNNIDFQIYAFFNSILVLFVIYYALNKLFSTPSFSLLYIIVAPFLTYIFSDSLILSIFPFILIYQLINQPTFKKYLLLFISIVLLIIWKIDLGYASLITAGIYLLILILSKNISINRKEFRKAFLTFSAIILGTFIIVILLRGSSYIFDNLKAAIHYFGANQAHGYSVVSYNFSHHFYISYFLLPTLSVLSILYISYQLWKNRTSSKDFTVNSIIPHAALFFFIFSLANAQRGIVRHGYAELNDGTIISTFYFAATLLIIFLLRNITPKQKQLMFYLGSFSLFILLKYYPFKAEYSSFDKALQKSSFINLHIDLSSKTNLKRTIPNEEFNQEKINDFKAFVGNNLSEEESFIDFSNTPMLYYYTNKKVPGYFCQNLQNTVDDYLQLHYLKVVNPEDYPIAVFSSYPESWFDITDSVPNAMRYYLIGEYIYKNYEPYAIMSNKRIWVAKNSTIQKNNIANKDTVSNVPYQYNYKKAAYYLYDFYERNQFQDLELIESWNTNSIESIDFTTLKNRPHHAYLLIEIDGDIKKSKPTLILKDSLGNECDLFKFDIEQYFGNKYLIRISNSYHWHTLRATALQLNLESGINLKSVQLFKDNRIEN